MKKPNFFIVGAPKCGTTALSYYLQNNPEVYISRDKEPHFFNTDDRNRRFNSIRRYERLFAGADEHHKAVGEASTWYLASEVAIPNIESYVESPRYIVCLRNPIEMAPSLHEQQIVSGNEPISNFEAAWALSVERFERRSAVRWGAEPRHLAYRHICALGSQLERLYQVVDESRVLPVLMDDLRENPRTTYLEVLDFLGVEDDGRVEFPRKNAAKARRSNAVLNMVKGLGWVRRRLNLPPGSGVLKKVNQMNVSYRPREPLADEMEEKLSEAFREEVAILQDILGRNLSHWLRK